MRVTLCPFFRGNISISIINIIEEFASSGFPLFMTRFDIFNLFEREEDDDSKITFELKILINDDELVKLDINVDFDDKLRNRSIATLNGFVIPNPGILKAILYNNGKEFSSYSVIVKKLGEPEKKVEVA